MASVNNILTLNRFISKSPPKYERMTTVARQFWQFGAQTNNNDYLRIKKSTTKL